jgi:DNA-binding NarL/FixJ family response regulator
VTRSLAAEGSRTAVVVLSIHPDESFVRSAVEAGVSGYVVKQDAARDLVQAVRAASRGEVFISPRVAGPLIGSLRGGGQDAQRPPLSPREQPHHVALARGLSSKQIAGELRLSPKTVEGYRTAIMDKLDIHSIAGLVKYAIREHLAGLEE